jgi:hypothetical protein
VATCYLIEVLVCNFSCMQSYQVDDDLRRTTHYTAPTNAY